MEMDNNTEIYMNDDVHKFCVSAVSCLVAGFGLRKMVQTWNSYSIPGIHLFDTVFYKNHENLLQPEVFFFFTHSASN